MKNAVIGQIAMAEMTWAEKYGMSDLSDIDVARSLAVTIAFKALDTTGIRFIKNLCLDIQTFGYESKPLKTDLRDFVTAKLLATRLAENADVQWGGSHA